MCAMAYLGSWYGHGATVYLACFLVCATIYLGSCFRYGHGATAYLGTCFLVCATVYLGSCIRYVLWHIWISDVDMVLPDGDDQHAR